jgi:uncharacterized membrane protein YkvA (DUF1232 family)
MCAEVALANNEPPLTDAQVSQLRSLDTQLPDLLFGGSDNENNEAHANNGLVGYFRRFWRQLIHVLTARRHAYTIQTWAVVVFVALYVLSPLDLIPDGVAGLLSFVDDFIVLIWGFFALRAIFGQYFRTNQR